MPSGMMRPPYKPMPLQLQLRLSTHARLVSTQLMELLAEHLTSKPPQTPKLEKLTRLQVEQVILVARQRPPSLALKSSSKLLRQPATQPLLRHGPQLLDSKPLLKTP